MRKLALAVVLICLGCASAPIKKQDQAALADADSKVLDGCYDCLLDARATYDRIGVGRARPLVIERLFAVQLLVVLREKELALDSSASFAKAQQLAKEMPLAVDADRYLAIVEAVPGDDQGWTHAETIAFRRAHVDFVTKITDEIVWLDTASLSAPIRRYLALAIDCAYPTRRRTGQPTLPVATRELPSDAPPLLVYRTAICGSIDTRPLEKVRADVPRFAEAAYFLSRVGLLTARQDGAPRAKEFLAEVRARFPSSPAVTYLTGNYNQLIGDCRAGLRAYDDTIAIKSAHEHALLGRTVCLTYLGQPDDAIVAATRIIALSLDNAAEAYYWRAWNRRVKNELDLARADIESARRMMVSGEIYTLAGMIEHDQDDLNPAENDLLAALTLSGGKKNCTAWWYLGLVQMKRERWIDSADRFNDAMGCFAVSVAESEQGLKAIQARTDLDPDFKARQIAGFEAAIKEDQSKQSAAAFNAANHYCRGGSCARALEFVDIAARDPALSERVDRMREILKTIK